MFAVVVDVVVLVLVLVALPLARELARALRNVVRRLLQTTRGKGTLERTKSKYIHGIIEIVTILFVGCRLH